MCSFPALLSLCEYQASRKSLSWKLPALSTIVAWSKYYGQIGSRAAQLRSCCLQPEPPFYVLLILFPRLCQSVYSIQNCNQRMWPCKQHLCTARRGGLSFGLGKQSLKSWHNSLISSKAAFLRISPLWQNIIPLVNHTKALELYSYCILQTFPFRMSTQKFVNNCSPGYQDSAT